MPYGGNDWLALTQEPTLEPELPICDPHHHFWDRRLQSLPYQRYLLDELYADIASGHNVWSTVFLEARSMYRPDGPVEMRPVGEVEFVQGLAAASASGIYGPSRAAAAIIGHADLKRGTNVAPVLDALQAASPNRFRGIRHNVTWSPDPAVDNRESEGILANATFREGAKVLRQKGLSLDIMISFPQMPEVADFARAVPELPIILNHIGALNRVGLYANREDEVRAAWRAGIAAVAACPNITLKLGGMGMPRMGFDWHTRVVPIGSEALAADMSPWMQYCIGRCLKGVDTRSKRSPELVSIDEEAKHEIVHVFCLRKTNRATHQSLDPRAEINVFALDFLRISLAHCVLRSVEMSLIGTPPTYKIV